MSPAWLVQGEEILGSWSVFLGGEGPAAAKVAGKLFVTDQNIHFEAGVALSKGAAALISNRIQAFEKTDQLLTIPFAEIGEARAVKKSMFVKALTIKLKSGEEIEFQFGAASPQPTNPTPSRTQAWPPLAGRRVSSAWRNSNAPGMASSTLVGKLAEKDCA